MNWFAHLTATFEQAERTHPGLMERYAVLLVETDDAAERVAIMRCGLRETIAQRYSLAATHAPIAHEERQGMLAL